MQAGRKGRNTTASVIIDYKGSTSASSIRSLTHSLARSASLTECCLDWVDRLSFPLPRCATLSHIDTLLEPLMPRPPRIDQTSISEAKYTMSATPYAAAIIETALASEQPILRFGEFTLKSGRQSPYFFNFGLFNSGALLLALASAFADAILDAYPDLGQKDASPDTPRVLFGPAYKGIPLVAAIATELARRGRDIGYSYNRKEKKDHGEGGSIVGAPLRGQCVLIVDDVITAGTAIREAHKVVEAEGGRTVGIAEALDREERGQGELSTVQEVERELGVKVTSVVKMRDIVAWLKSKGKLDEMKAMEQYRAQWGI